jgi:hypothetical protein
MLDRGGPPDAELLGLLQEFDPLMKDHLIEGAIAAQREAGLAVRLVCRRQHGIKLKDFGAHGCSQFFGFLRRYAKPIRSRAVVGSPTLEETPA